jgi:hypothetical protein
MIDSFREENRATRFELLHNRTTDGNGFIKLVNQGLARKRLLKEQTVFK